MKTKLQSKIRVFSKTDDYLFYISQSVCILLIILGILGFLSSFLLTSAKNEHQSIAVVSDRIKTSKRCVENRNLWDYLQSNSKIYDGDTIRTGQNSQITILFDDDTQLILAPNTMTQIKMDKDKNLEFLLTDGRIILDSGKNENTSIIYKNTKISAKGKADISAHGYSNDKSDKKSATKEKEKSNRESLEIKVLDGNVHIKSPGQEEVEIERGTIAKISQNKRKTEITSEITSDKVELLSHTKNEMLKTNSTDKNSALLSKPIVQALDESASEKTKSVQTSRTSQSLFSNFSTEKLENLQSILDNQTALNDKSKSNESKSQVAKKAQEQKKSQEITIALKKPVLVQPQRAKIFDDKYFISEDKIVFSWEKVENATNYKFVLKNEKGKILVEKKVGNKTSFIFTELSKLENGKFTWSVQALKTDFGNATISSEVQSSTFTIQLSKISGSSGNVNQVDKEN